MSTVASLQDTINLVTPPAAVDASGNNGFAQALNASLTESNSATDGLLKVTFPPSQSSDTTGRFSRLVPGAFHSKTAFQKPLLEPAPNVVEPAVLNVQVNQVVSTKPASAVLLVLLGETASTDRPEQAPVEPEAITAAASPAIDGTIPPPQLLTKPHDGEAEIPAPVASQSTAQPSAVASSYKANAEPALEPDNTKDSSQEISLFDRLATKADMKPQTKIQAENPNTQNFLAISPQGNPSPIEANGVVIPQAPARPHAVPIAQVPHLLAIEARKLDMSGTREFTIRLDPAELGRIDVKLEVKPDGYVTAIVQADQASTFDLLRQDARGFEQSLADSGLKTNSDSLNFSLRRDGEQSFAQLMLGEPGNSSRHSSKQTAEDAGLTIAIDSAALKNHRLSLSQIDVMA